MKLIKLDGRYSHSRKFSWAAQFIHPRPRVNSSHVPYYQAFEAAFGKEKQRNPECKSSSFFTRDYYVWNEAWFYDSKHNRICFKNESDLTAALLFLGTR